MKHFCVNVFIEVIKTICLDTIHTFGKFFGKTNLFCYWVNIYWGQREIDMFSFNMHSLITSIIIVLLSIYIFFSRCLLIETKLLVSLTTDLFICTSIDSVHIRNICALHICKFKWIIVFQIYHVCLKVGIGNVILSATRAAYPTYMLIWNNLEEIKTCCFQCKCGNLC